MDSRNGRKRARWYGDEEEVVDGWLAGWTAGRLGACARVARGRQTEYPPVSPTSGTFVNPFVRLILISPSQLRKTTAAFLRARRLPRTLLADLSHAHLSLLLPSLPFPPLFLMDSTQHPSLCYGGGNMVQLFPSRSFARSFLSVIPAVRFVLCLAVYPCVRLSPPPSRYNLILSRGVAIPPQPKRRHTHARFPLPLIPQPSFCSVQRYLMQIRDR